MAFTASMFPKHQTLRQKSLAWKMAASSSHPLMTRPIHVSRKGSIQILESSPEDEGIQVIRRWCALHKTNKHSDSDCRAQQESTPPIAAKRQPTGDRKVSKPRRLGFKSTTDREKFLRSIEEMEGVSFDDSTNEDDCNIVAQSLTQLHTTPLSESTDEEDSHLDLHVLVLLSRNAVEEDDVVMEEVYDASGDKENQDLSQVPCSNQDLLNTEYQYGSPRPRFTGKHLSHTPRRTSGNWKVRYYSTSWRI